jgi:hypothetical protein
MTRLILQLLLRISLFISTITGLLLLGLRSDQPPTLLRIPDFAICDFPCWAGVVPTETLFARAPQILDSYLPTRSLDFNANLTQISFRSTEGIPLISGMIYGERDRVTALRLDVSLPLWTLIEALGKPTCARTARLSGIDRESITVYWETSTHTLLGLIVLENTSHWRPDVPIRYLLIAGVGDECALLNAPRWQGFAHIWYYR